MRANYESSDYETVGIIKNQTRGGGRMMAICRSLRKDVVAREVLILGGGGGSLERRGGWGCRLW